MEDPIADTQDTSAMETHSSIIPTMYSSSHHLLQLGSNHTPWGSLPCHRQPPMDNGWGDPPLESQLASPSREAPSVFMAPLTQIIDPRSEALHTPSQIERLASFSAPYLMANPLTACEGDTAMRPLLTRSPLKQMS